MDLAEDNKSGDLRARITRLRQELTDTTEAYRNAAAHRDSEKAILLLRSRSHLMRQLLESQCEFLLALRSEPVEVTVRLEMADPSESLRSSAVEALVPSVSLTEDGASRNLQIRERLHQEFRPGDAS